MPDEEHFSDRCRGARLVIAQSSRSRFPWRGCVGVTGQRTTWDGEGGKKRLGHGFL